MVVKVTDVYNGGSVTDAITVDSNAVAASLELLVSRDRLRSAELASVVHGSLCTVCYIQYLFTERLQNPASDEPAEESRLLALLANVLEAMVDATEQREQARLQARLQVHPDGRRPRLSACMHLWLGCVRALYRWV